MGRFSLAACPVVSTARISFAPRAKQTLLASPDRYVENRNEYLAKKINVAGPHSCRCSSLSSLAFSRSAGAHNTSRQRCVAHAKQARHQCAGDERTNDDAHSSSTAAVAINGTQNLCAHCAPPIQGRTKQNDANIAMRRNEKTKHVSTETHTVCFRIQCLGIEESCTALMFRSMCVCLRSLCVRLSAFA